MAFIEADIRGFSSATLPSPALASRRQQRLPGRSNFPRNLSRQFTQ